jgi:hypothetical protein
MISPFAAARATERARSLMHGPTLAQNFCACATSQEQAREPRHAHLAQPPFESLASQPEDNAPCFAGLESGLSAEAARQGNFL